MSQPCPFCFRPESVKMRGRNNVLTTSLHIIERYALNANGDVGSFYNVYTDNLIITSSINKDSLTQKIVQETPVCKLIKVDAHNRGNIIKLIGIEDELRVSVALSMTKVIEGISMLYSYEPPVDRTVRLISYCRVDQEEYLPDDIQVMRKLLSDILPDNGATHIITSVRRGVDFVIVLEFPQQANDHEIDPVLEKLCDYFIKPKTTFLSTEDQRKINQLRPIIFTSINEIRSFAESTDLSVICQQILQFTCQNRNKSTLSYTLHPVKCIYYDQLFNDTQYCKLDPYIVRKIEEKLLPLLNQLRRLERLFQERVKPQLLSFLKTRVESTYDGICRVKGIYTKIKQALAVKVDRLRRDELELSLLEDELSLLEDELNDTQLTKLESELNTLETTIIELQNKSSFITKLQTDFEMEYLNVAELEEASDNQETLEKKLRYLDQNNSKYYFCSTNQLVERNPNDLKKSYEDLKAELRRTTLTSHLVFADFSYCTNELKTTKLLRPTPSLTTIRSIVQAEEINILLIGETGVGKSTFINAFVNYLAFPSLEQAANQKPIVLIPVSFLITIGDHFEEKHIDFGQFDENENHNQSGHSVTQHCKAYIFTIQNNIKLRIIDTPGFGDTRGIKQDDENIDHILSYISNLPHLNAICFLLKPNSTRLHVLFRSCFTQLFNFLGPNVRENIIFCFTNTRATFYTPGDTAKLLKVMLEELPMNHKPLFAKQNTFCFDSESFRYLAVIRSRQTLAFDDEQKLDFAKSWKMSVTESTRLLSLVKCRPQFPMNKWHSIKHAQMTITSLAQPILETIRNCIQNSILRHLDNKQRIIEFKPYSISVPAWLCTICPYIITQIENISIATHPIHGCRAPSKCDKCPCASTEHLPIFYQLNYQFGGVKGIRFSEEILNTKDRLLSGSVILSQFLLDTTGTSQNPFLFWFDLFIRQQEYLCSKYPTSIGTIKICNDLHNEKTKYVNDLQDIKRNNERIELDAIYSCMEEILVYPRIAEQMDAIKESQMQMMKSNECDVSSQHPHMNSSF